MADQDSTLAGIPQRARGRLALTASRAFITLLTLVCVAGGTGLLGGHTASATTVGSGYRLTLSYPGITRPGLDAFWELRVTHQGGFRGNFTLAITGSYFDIFETQGFYPTPAATTRDGTNVYLTFTPPSKGDTFVVMYDAYIQPYVSPSHLLAQRATVAVVKHNKRLASLPFTTWVWP